MRSLVQETMDVISSREYDLGHITVDGANSLDLKKVKLFTLLLQDTNVNWQMTTPVMNCSLLP